MRRIMAFISRMGPKEKGPLFTYKESSIQGPAYWPTSGGMSRFLFLIGGGLGSGPWRPWNGRWGTSVGCLLVDPVGKRGPYLWDGTTLVGCWSWRTMEELLGESFGWVIDARGGFVQAVRSTFSMKSWEVERERDYPACGGMSLRKVWQDKHCVGWYDIQVNYTARVSGSTAVLLRRARALTK